MMNQSTPETIDVRTVDRQLLEALRGEHPLGIAELTAALGVTATAVRQRIERLLESGLVSREKVVSGRGRPTFAYQLTLLGHRRAGADYAELADAMWHEILAIDSPALRQELLSRIARRLGKQYRQQLSADPSAQSSLESRMESLKQILSGHRIPADISTVGQLPVIGFLACPHPDLASSDGGEGDGSYGRAMCHLEEEMLSEALGSPVHLHSCRLDGDRCCQFVATSTDPAPGSIGDHRS